MKHYLADTDIGAYGAVALVECTAPDCNCGGQVWVDIEFLDGTSLQITPPYSADEEGWRLAEEWREDMVRWLEEWAPIVTDHNTSKETDNE